MTSKHNFVFSCLLVFFFSLAGCGGSQTDKSVAYAQDLQKAVNEFEDTRSQTATDVKTKTEEVAGALSKAENSEDVKNAGNTWESAWSDINDRITALETNYKTVSENADSYFGELDRLANGIKNPVLRESETLKNRTLKARWMTASSEAAEALGKMKNLHAEAGDFANVLTAAVMREKITRNIEELRVLSAQANSILNDLAKLTAEGRKLTQT